MIKSKELIEGCIAKASDDEPVFVLRAKDPLAPLAVRAWAEASNATGLHKTEKTLEALALADSMIRYRRDTYETNGGG